MDKVELKLKYSWTYNRQFNLDLPESEFENKVWKNVLITGKKFERLYKEHIERIIELIPKFSGYKWGELSDTFIPIYLVKKEGFCFSDPLTLKIDKDIVMMLVALVHELCHRNMPFVIEDPEKDPLEREILMNLVTVAVFKNLNIRADKQLRLLIDSTKELYKETYTPIDLDVSKITIKGYIQNRKTPLAFPQS